MGARTEVGAYLAEHLPDTWTVYDHGRQLDGVQTATVMVEQSAVKPGVSQGLRTSALAVYVAVGGQDPAKVEDALEDALDVLLDVLDGIPHVSLSADRVVLQNTIPAYTVTLEVPVRKEPRP